jgi:hypothetical protein
LTEAASLTIAAATRPGGAGYPDPVALLASPAPSLSEVREALADLGPEGTSTLLRRLIHERVDGLAWRTLASLPIDTVDPWLRATLRRRHEARAAVTLTQGLALAEILESLQRAGVPVIVHRGLRAVEWIYKDAGARPFTDHDLLIRPGDAALAREVLGRLGFEALSPGFFRRATVFVDLHVDPLGAVRRPARARLFPIDLDALFRDGAEGLVAGGPAILLRPEDELVLMAIHVVKHSFDRLIRSADLAHLLAFQGRTLSWDRVRSQAGRFRATRLLTLALAALEPLGVRPPGDHGADEAALGGLERLLLERVRRLRPLPYAGEIVMAMQARTLGDRLRFAWDALFPRDGAPAAPAAGVPARSSGVVLLEDAARARRDRRAGNAAR